jgi:hypothetical protein
VKFWYTNMRWIAFVAVVAVALVAAAGTADAKGSNCVSGDLPCACAAAGGKWRDLKSPLVPTCTVAIRHQGAQPRRRRARRTPLAGPAAWPF